jgi:integrase
MQLNDTPTVRHQGLPHIRLIASQLQKYCDVDHIIRNFTSKEPRRRRQLGFAGPLRRSEPVGLDVEDFDFASAGLVVTLQRSKTDQDGDGRKLGVPYGSRLETSPVRTSQSWLSAAAITAGPVFREITKADHIIDPYTDKKGRQRGGRLGDKAVALIVKRAAQAAGLDPTRYAGHSLRAGLATSAAAAEPSPENRSTIQRSGDSPCSRTTATSLPSSRM